MIYSLKFVFVFFIIVNYVCGLPFQPINNPGMGLNPFNMNLRRYLGNLQANNNFINRLGTSNLNGYGTNIQLNRQSDSGLNVGTNINYDDRQSQGDLSQQQHNYNNGNIQQYYPGLNAQTDEFQTQANDAPQLNTTSTAVSNTFNYATTASSSNTSKSPIINEADRLVKEKDKIKNELKREHESDNDANHKHKHALKSMTKTKFFFQFQTVVPAASRKIKKETVYYLE